MTKRALLFGIALAVAGLVVSAGAAAPAASKEATVTLSVTGMT